MENIDDLIAAIPKLVVGSQRVYIENLITVSFHRGKTIRGNNTPPSDSPEILGSQESCGNCAFWDETVHNGVCNNRHAIFTKTPVTFSCGYYKARTDGK